MLAIGSATKLLRTPFQARLAALAAGAGERSILPYPGSLIKERTNCALVYVSLDERQDVDLRGFLRERAAA